MKLADINPFIRSVRVFDMYKDRTKIVPLQMPADCRLIYGLEGTGKIGIDGKLFSLKPGDLFIINAGVRYKAFKAVGKSIVINFSYTRNFCHLKFALPPVYDIANITEQVNFDDHPVLDKYIFCRNMHSAKNIIQDVVNEVNKKLPDYDIISSLLLKSVIFTAVRKSAAEIHINTNLDLDSVILYIHENFTKNINNNTLSEHFHFHPNYINNVFKRYTGKTVHQYIIELRITNAISLLKESDLSIDEIARATGFYDCSYFSKYFKKATGVSPKEYRKK